MDIKSFLRLVNRYKWLLIIAPAIAITGAFFLVKNLPKQYRSEVRISTGILDPSKKLVSTEATDYFKISQQFSNIMDKLRAKKITDLLSYNLMLHDLQRPNESFRKYSKQLDSLRDDQKVALVNEIKTKLSKKSILTLADNKGKYRLYDIVASMGYGEEGLTKHIDIAHVENSDFIDISFLSESPDLSAFVVNTLASEFILNYSSDINTNQNVSLAMLDSLLKRKESVMNEKNAALSSFKRTKGVLNLDEQSATVYSQISQYEVQRAQALREIQSDQGAISIIERKLRGSDPYVKGSSRNDNQDIIRLKRQLEIANASYIDNNFNPKDQKKVDSLTRILSEKSARNIDENVLDPRTSKQSLVQQKLSLEIALQQAKSSIKTLDNQLSILRARYQSMVPYDADIQNYEREAELATKDYMAALDSYNTNRTSQKMGLQLQIEQSGLPGNPEPSKEVLYIAGAGFSSVMLCFAFLFVLFLLNSSIDTLSQLELATKSKSLGLINFIEGSERSIRNIWADKSGNHNYETFKDLLRSLRFEIGSKMDAEGSKILGITSLVNGEGKTFLSYSLAYAFAMTGRKILLIADDQVVVKSDSKELSTSQNFQKFLIKKEIHVEDLITVMNKNTEKDSLLEIQNVKNLKLGFEVLRKEFDLIIIDINSLSDMNITKEWLLFTEQTICVYESGRSLTEGDKKYIDFLNVHPGFIGWVLNKYKSHQVT
jgi:Mrp family chromosome partitioning ATPase/capsular polysaccharide biosynthesis protein